MRFGAVCSLLTLTLMTAGCSRPPSAVVTPTATVSPTGTPVTPTVTPTATVNPVLSRVTVTLPGQLDTLNPLLSRSPAARSVASLVFSGLVHANGDGTYRPALAAHWSSPDGLTWTFKLDPSARWQDGVPVTSADVAYTLRLIQQPGSPVDPALQTAWRGIQVATPDSTTVVLSVPATLGAGVLDLATLPILPAHLLAAVPASSLEMLPFSSHPIGSGPYRVVSADSFAVTLEATAEAPQAPRQLRLRFESGAEPAIAPDAGAAIRWLTPTAPSGGRVVDAPLNRPVFLFLNTRRGPTADPAIRRALAQAINRRSLIESALASNAVPLMAPYPPEFWASATAAQAPGYDRQAAGATLQSDGWLRTATGTRSRQDVPLALTVLVDSDPARLAVAQGIAAMWQAIGVKTTVEQAGLSGLVKDFGDTGNFDALVLGVQQRGARPALAALWHTGGALNISGWSDPLADAALDATKNADQSVQATGYARFAQRFADEAPAIPLYLPVARYVVTGFYPRLGLLNSDDGILRDAPNWRVAP